MKTTVQIRHCRGTRSIADGLIPEEHECHRARFMNNDGSEAMMCPWCDLTVTIRHGGHARCDRDHVMFLLGAAVYVWTREADVTRRIRMDLVADETAAEDDRIARRYGFGVLGAHILTNHPKPVVTVASPPLPVRIWYFLKDRKPRGKVRY